MCKNYFILLVFMGYCTTKGFTGSLSGLKVHQFKDLDTKPSLILETTNPNHYQSSGNKFDFPEFDPVKVNFPPGTQSITIKNHRIDLSRFIPKIESLNSLQSIFLEQIQLVNETARFGRVQLPALKKFVFHHIESSSTFLEDELVNSPFSLKSLLFFDKTSENWELPQIWDLGVDISLSIGNFKIFEISHEGNGGNLNGSSFTTALRDPNGILQNIPQNLSSLTFTGTWHNAFIDPSFIPRNLSFLSLHRIRTNLDELELLLNASNNLRELRIRDLRPSARIDISKMPLSLKRVSLIQTIFYFRSASRKYNLDSLILFGSESEDFFYPNYERVLNARNVAFSEKYHDTSTNKSYALLRSILNTTRVENIYVQNFYRKPQGFENRSDILEFEDFLGNASVPRDSLDFHLKKLADDSWLGRKLAPEESEYALLSNFEGYVPKYKLIDPQIYKNDLKPLGLNSIEFFQFINLPFFERQPKGSIGSIHFNDVEIFAPSFPRLVRGFNQLRYLTLENVRIFGKFPRSGNLSLPSIRKFSLSKHRPKGGIKTNWAELETFELEDIDSALFFNRRRRRIITEEIWDLGISFIFAAGQIKMLELNIEAKEFISSLKTTNEFLISADDLGKLKFTSWAIKDSTLDLNLLPSTTIQYLNLQNVDFLNETNIGQVLAPMLELRELYIFPEFKFSLQRKALSLNRLPQGGRLKKVFIRNFLINDSLRFAGVTNLTFQDCIFSDEAESANTFAGNIQSPYLSFFGLNYPRPNLLSGFIDALLENNSTRKLFFDNLKAENLSESLKSFLTLQGLDVTKSSGLENILLSRNTGAEGWTARTMNLVERELLYNQVSDLGKFKIPADETKN